MAKTRIENLTEYLFGQLEKVAEIEADAPLSDAELDREIRRTEAVVSVATQIINAANIQLKAAELSAKLNGCEMELPQIVQSRGTKLLLGRGGADG
jgi:hypothetical protein